MLLAFRFCHWRHHAFGEIGFVWSEYGTVISIDLGTTYSCVGNHRRRPKVVIWVSFSDDERLVGDSAENTFHSNPRNTIFDAKCLIGRKMDHQNIQYNVKHWPFKVQEKNSKPAISVEYKGETDFIPKEISVTSTTLSVRPPRTLVSWSSVSSTSLPQGGECQITVYDLGGGTFDVSFLSIEDVKISTTVSLTTSSKPYKKNTGTDVTSNLHAMGTLKREVEKDKRTLSNQQSTCIEGGLKRTASRASAAAKAAVRF
ncbi:HSP70-domain-containing protein [Hymenopellis radicata]|nr:HSP70-domain-containing protein [Hymenopellis radicata]